MKSFMNAATVLLAFGVSVAGTACCCIPVSDQQSNDSLPPPAPQAKEDAADTAKRVAPDMPPADQEPLKRVGSDMPPSDVSYTIIDSHTVPGIKRSLEIRLNKKVSADTLRQIALKLKADDSRNYQRTFIAYYLPDMTLGAGAWATTHFNPNLDVRILGLTAEEETSLTDPPPADREVIGRWLDEGPFLGSRITIFRKNGKLYAELQYADGSSSNKELIEQPSSLGRRFDGIEGSRTGDHWIVDDQGKLQIRDNEGLINTAKPIR